MPRPQRRPESYEYYRTGRILLFVVVIDVARMDTRMDARTVRGIEKVVAMMYGLRAASP